MTLDQIIDEVLVREGWPKYTNLPGDKGGPTRGGITLKTLSAWRNRPCTADDVQNLQAPEIREIYTYEYATKWKFDMIPDAWVKDFIIDTGILQGQPTAAKMLQSVLGVPEDMKLGPTTFAALNMALEDHRRLKKALIRKRMHLLLDAMVTEIPLHLRTETNLRWRHGWWNRVCDTI